jgi:GDSL-like Lipase/Acylhydrolase family
MIAILTALRRTALILSFLMSTLSVVLAQDAPFDGLPLPPFGSGHRLLKGYLNPNGQATSAIEVFVFYAQNAEALANPVVGGPLPQAKARVQAENGRIAYSFIFPHTDHPRPNGSSDLNQQAIGSNRTVYYRVVRRVGTQLQPDEVRRFRMPDKLTIALLGDSYASGEGAPDDPSDADNGNMWHDAVRHRSLRSGQVRATKELKENHPELSIAFRQRASSGAVSTDFYSTQQRTNGGTVVPTQLSEIRLWLDENRYDRLDILLMSVGGNDMGLVGLVTDYLYTPFRNLHTDEPMKAQLNEAIGTNLPTLYRQLDNYARANFTLGKVLITEYPNPLNGPDGVCGGDLIPGPYTECWGPLEDQNPRAEFSYARDRVMVPVNNQIRASAQELGWTFVGGAFAASGSRGICNCTGFFNGIVRSLATQGDERGTFHPNALGHREVYQPVIFRALMTAVTQIRDDWERIRIQTAEEEARQKEQQENQKRVYRGRYDGYQLQAQGAAARLLSFRNRYSVGEEERRKLIDEIRRSRPAPRPRQEELLKDRFSGKTPDDN